MREYKPSNKVGLLGIPLMLAGILVSGAIIGGIAFFVSYQFHFFLIIIFPLIMGVAAAVVVMQAAKFGKVRNPKLATILGLLAGIAIIGVWYGTEYEIGFRRKLAEEARSRLGVTVTQEEANRVADAFLIDETGQSGIIGYLLYTAQQGSTLSYRLVFNIPLNGFFTWVVRLIEWGIILGFCSLAGLAQATQPFNERTNQWYGDWKPFAQASWRIQPHLLLFMKRGDFQNAGKCMTNAELALPRLEIEVTGDEHDNESDWVLKITNVEPTQKNPKRIHLMTGLITPQELGVVRSAMPDQPTEQDAAQGG